ncbi:MAG: hypothetical protein NVS2B8_10530 [Vulcanimicrobiaceae bacterium]
MRVARDLRDGEHRSRRNARARERVVGIDEIARARPGGDAFVEVDRVRDAGLIGREARVVGKFGRADEVGKALEDRLTVAADGEPFTVARRIDAAGRGTQVAVAVASRHLTRVREFRKRAFEQTKGALDERDVDRLARARERAIATGFRCEIDDHRSRTHAAHGVFRDEHGCLAARNGGRRDDDVDRVNVARQNALLLGRLLGGEGTRVAARAFSRRAEIDFHEGSVE